MTGDFTIYKNNDKIFHQELGSRCCISDYVKRIVEVYEYSGKQFDPDIRKKLMDFVDKINWMKRNYKFDESANNLLIVVINTIKLLYDEKFTFVDTEKYTYWVERELVKGIGKLDILPDDTVYFSFS